ncbi:hypothetical protein [Cronobacter phage JC01]|uniref:Uncharacterized protein n=1 Tax=Cronobacter phage JC01 TaxID=2729575 RepID=A0A6M3YKH7_9CAUD|nr:hypothetical protein JT331_gp56 [Cronobacter phage JC01]QJI52293.1 hypothetical protein [Cronobacter phage JC01]
MTSGISAKKRAKTTMTISDISPETRQKHEELLARLAIGDSFFLENVLPKHCTYLRKLGYKLNLRLAFRFVERDEIYGKTGTRIKRVS